MARLQQQGQQTRNNAAPPALTVQRNFCRKNLWRIVVLGVIGPAIFTGVVGAENYWVEADVNTRSVKLGEAFTYTLTAGARHGWVALPGESARVEGCQISQYQENDVSKKHEGFLARQGIYRLVPFALDAIYLPALPAHFRWADGTTATAVSLPITIQIQSLNPDPGLSLIDPRPPRSRFFWEWLWVALPMLAAGLWLWQTQRRRRRKKHQPAIAPSVQAMKRLEILGKSRLVAEASKSGQYFTELSRIMRSYLAEQYRIPAMEMSRQLIIAALENLDVEAKRRNMISQLLDETDLIKFAQETVDFKRVAEMHNLAREIIQLTKNDENGRRETRPGE